MARHENDRVDRVVWFFPPTALPELSDPVDHMWNPASKGYTLLVERAPSVHSKWAVRTLVGCLLFGLIVIFHDLPFSTSSSDPYTRCQSTAGKHTAVLGGVPGFLVLENVWYRNETFYVFNPDTSALPKEDEVLSAPGTIVHASSVPAAIPDFCLKGSTLFLNENDRAGWSGLWHYYHFAAENIVAGLATLALAGIPGVPDQLIIPWDRRWHDRFGMNEMVVRGIWGLEFEAMWAPDDWDSYGREGENWGFFEKVAIIDRWVSHRKNPSADRWNKMSLPIFEQNPPVGFFESARQTLLETYEIRSPALSAPHVVYVDRQNTDRRLPNETHDALLDLFAEFDHSGRVEFKHVVLEDLTPHEQIETVAYADIMVGIHGNGLTHEMWMPARSTLIELFHPISFLRDYESIATALGHSYYAVQNDSILQREQWEAEPGERHAGMMHDGSTVYLDVEFFRSVLDDALRRYQL
ncbi:hypothetical protein DB88DRAFT_490663 [Papiliotrema laurentii]|uniref:Glycosyltransferase 61 catalytic domain-containing protein n=1 Tax=Papiliotrema laurentii TaxID=5418 RepID=A0AAD9FQT8_PAPLA|nr:hypothetical protein DB88DRAFT_490663 [Papiliotrema laurentii]